MRYCQCSFCTTPAAPAGPQAQALPLPLRVRVPLHSLRLGLPVSLRPGYYTQYTGRSESHWYCQCHWHWQGHASPRDATRVNSLHCQWQGHGPGAAAVRRGPGYRYYCTCTVPVVLSNLSLRVNLNFERGESLTSTTCKCFNSTPHPLLKPSTTKACTAYRRRLY